MKHYINLVMFVVISSILILNVSYSQYWFQSGAKSAYSAEFNNGSSIYIQTIYQNHPEYGSFAYWVGESLKNGAFIQIGYEVPNMSGEYANNCSPTGCSSVVNLTAGVPTWFWEYFPANYSGNNFYGSLGPTKSVGVNGTFNEYGFRALDNTWYLFFNNRIIGSVMLNTTTSGGYLPVAFAEYADALSNNSSMIPVKFRNFSFYNQSIVKTVAEAYSYVGYGKNSDTSLKNPYGVIEVANTLDYFEAGSNLPIYKNNTLLWNIGYYLNTYSRYGNLSQSSQYLAYSTTTISAPKYIYFGKYQRAIFSNWTGKGYGSYTGPNNTAIVAVNGNISEFANWKTQYYVNVNTSIGNVSGNGWYDNGSIATISLSKNISYINQSARFIFQEWNNTYKNMSINVLVNSPLIFNAIWKKQYYVNVNTSIGNVSGNGWYDNGSIATISLINQYRYINKTNRIGFIGWSNSSYSTNTVYVKINSPLVITALFSNEHLININSKNEMGAQVYPNYYTTSIGKINSTSFIPDNGSLLINSAFYNGITVPINKTINMNNISSISIVMPLYDISIKTTDYLFIPVNATLNITFKNNTNIVLYTGNQGIINFKNVPLGFISGNAVYEGKTILISTVNGSTNIFFFDGNSAVLFTAIIIIIIFLVADKLIKRKRHPWHQKIHRR